VLLTGVDELHGELAEVGGARRRTYRWTEGTPPRDSARHRVRASVWLVAWCSSLSLFLFLFRALWRFRAACFQRAVPTPDRRQSVSASVVQGYELRVQPACRRDREPAQPDGPTRCGCAQLPSLPLLLFSCELTPGRPARCLAELKADKDGAKEYQDEIDKLNRRKMDLQKNIKKNQEWCDNFDKQIGGVQDKYDHFLDDMVVLYDNACKKHAQGIQFLMDHFSYHPLFKHWDDDFSAVPFRPKAK
jgi:hypothetical protein